MSCRFIQSSRVLPGWGCCRCGTYNGLQRPACRACDHEPCDLVVPQEIRRCPDCGFGFDPLHAADAPCPSCEREAAGHSALPLIMTLALLLLAPSLRAQETPTPPADADEPQAVEVEATEDEPSPWVAAMWLPVRDARPTDEELTGEGAAELTGLDIGVGVALHTFKGRAWRLVPAALTLGAKSIAVGPAWIVSKREAKRVTAIGGGVGVPWDEHGVYWNERQWVVGVTRSFDVGGD